MLLDQMAINGMSSSSSSPFFPPNFLLQIQNTATHDHQEDQLRRHHHQQQQPPNPLSFLLSPNPQDYISVATMVGKRSVSFSGCEEAGAAGEDDVDLSDEYCSGLAGERKRRLSMEQVRTLEKNFEAGNKLEPERKMRLAAALGLQPRQVAIWFQNRRARWRTKQLEEDYNALKRQLEAVKSESKALQAHNKKLQAEISSLKGRETPESINLNKETEGSCSNRSENSSELNLDISRGTPPAAIESPLNPHQSIPFFPTTTIRPAPTMVQLLQSSAAACPKIEHNSVVPDENFSNLLCSMDDQSGFWTWSDPHSFH